MLKGGILRELKNDYHRSNVSTTVEVSYCHQKNHEKGLHLLHKYQFQQEMNLQDLPLFHHAHLRVAVTLLCKSYYVIYLVGQDQSSKLTVYEKLKMYNLLVQEEKIYKKPKINEN